jgi:hypothetical protein
VTGNTVIETFSDTLVQGGPTSSISVGTTYSVCVEDSTDPNDNGYCFGAYYITDTYGNNIGSLYYNGYTLSLPTGQYYSAISGGSGKFGGASGYILVNESADASYYNTTIVITNIPPASTPPITIQFGNVVSTSTGNFTAIPGGTSLELVIDNLFIQSSLDSGSAQGLSFLACFGIGSVLQSALQQCFGVILINSHDGDPLGYINVQGNFPADGQNSPFYFAITGGTGYFVNAWGTISGIQTADGLSWHGIMTIVPGEKPSSTQSVWEYVGNPLAQANVSISLIQVFDVPFYSSYTSGTPIGIDHQLCVDASSLQFGSVVCLQVLNFLDPVSQNLVGQIYYAGLFPPFLDSGYTLLGIIGGTGIYNGVGGQIVNRQNVGGFSFQYDLWYSSPPQLTPVYVPIVSGSVPTPPSPPSPTSTPTSSTTSSSLISSSGSYPSGIVIAAIVLAVFAIVFVVILTIFFAFKQHPKFQST